MSHRSVDFLIVGGGIAGYSCARALRSAGADGSILIVSRDPELPYDRRMCTKDLLRGTSTSKDALLESESWYQDHGIDLAIRTAVTRLDVADGRATLTDACELQFGRALLATGAGVRRIRVEGSTLDGVHYIRTLANAEAIRADADRAESVVLIGGSYIATEVAASFSALGKRCTIVMQEGVTLERGFGTRAGALVQRLLRERGVDVCGGDELVRIEGNGRVSRVITRQGRRIPAQLVVLGTGALPDVSLGRGAGLPIGATGGLLTDSTLQVAQSGVFAAGDVAEYPSAIHGGARVRVEHWAVAEEQGITAALGMLGKGREHNVVPYFSSALADWLTLEYVGAASAWDEEIIRGSLDDLAFTTFYLRSGRVVAALTAGRSTDLDAARALIASGISVEAWRTELADVELDLAALLDAASTGAVARGGETMTALDDTPASWQRPEGREQAPDLYMCAFCGFVYDAVLGDIDGGVPSLTRFEELPNGWTCPVCGAQPSEFTLIRA